MSPGVTALIYRGLAVAIVLFAVYALSKGFAWLLDNWGPDARALRNQYTENANRALVQSRMPAPLRIHDRELAHEEALRLERIRAADHAAIDGLLAGIGRHRKTETPPNA